MIHAVQIIQQLRITRVFVDSSGANGDLVKCFSLFRPSMNPKRPRLNDSA
jgi:hypothetical protein